MYKAYEVTKDGLIDIIDVLLPSARIVARYKEEPEGIILVATPNNIYDMVEDTCPDDAIFEIWFDRDKESLS